MVVGTASGECSLQLKVEHSVSKSFWQCHGKREEQAKGWEVEDAKSPSSTSGYMVQYPLFTKLFLFSSDCYLSQLLSSFLKLGTASYSRFNMTLCILVFVKIFLSTCLLFKYTVLQCKNFIFWSIKLIHSSMSQHPNSASLAYPTMCSKSPSIIIQYKPPVHTFPLPLLQCAYLL